MAVLFRYCMHVFYVEFAKVLIDVWLEGEDVLSDQRYFSGWRVDGKPFCPTLLAEYAYVMAIGGIVYTVTDVHELHLWMKQHFTDHQLFRPMEPEEYKDDVVVEKILHSTEEGKKVERNAGDKYLAIFQRIEDPYLS